MRKVFLSQTETKQRRRPDQGRQLLQPINRFPSANIWSYPAQLGIVGYICKNFSYEHGIHPC